MSAELLRHRDSSGHFLLIEKYNQAGFRGFFYEFNIKDSFMPDKVKIITYVSEKL